MQGFSYRSPTRIEFGPGAVERIGDLFDHERPSTVLQVSSGDYPEELGISDAVLRAASARGITVVTDSGAEPNPKIEPVRRLVGLARREGVDLVLAVGGGSAIDTAKAVALGVPHDGDVWDFFAGTARPRRALPVGVVSTLPGSGSELSDCAVIQNGDRKVFLESDLILPRFAVVDPAYSLGVPAPYQASAVADMTAHLLEVYATDTTPVDVTDRLIEASFASLLTYGRRAVERPGDVDARAELHMLSLVTHNDGFLANGRLADWVGHKIEHEISGRYGLIHGEGMAVVTPAWIRFVAARKPRKLVQFAHRVFKVDVFDRTDEDVVTLLAERLEAFYRSLGLRTRLAEHGIGAEAIPGLAARATHGGTRTLGHYVTLDAADVGELLAHAL